MIRRALGLASFAVLFPAGTAVALAGCTMAVVGVRAYDAPAGTPDVVVRGLMAMHGVGCVVAVAGCAAMAAGLRAGEILGAR